jgi:hypothetical protein
MAELKPAVTRVTNLPRLLPTGEVEGRVQIQYTIGPHGPFTLNLAEKDFTAEKVNAEMNAKAKVLAALPLAG